MKKFIKYGVIVIVGVAVLLAAFYFLFPEAAFRLAFDAHRRSADLVKKEVLVDNHRIVYLEGGTGETIVLLHGFGGSKDQWTAFAKYLKGYRLVIPDVPGFGESSQVPTDNYGVESQVGRIDRFVEVLKLDKFHMAGNSMGGAYAAAYGAKHPGKVLTLPCWTRPELHRRTRASSSCSWRRATICCWPATPKMSISCWPWFTRRCPPSLLEEICL